MYVYICANDIQQLHCPTTTPSHWWLVPKSIRCNQVVAASVKSNGQIYRYGAREGLQLIRAFWFNNWGASNEVALWVSIQLGFFRFGDGEKNILIFLPFFWRKFVQFLVSKASPSPLPFCFVISLCLLWFCDWLWHVLLLILLLRLLGFIFLFLCCFLV